MIKTRDNLVSKAITQKVKVVEKRIELRVGKDRMKDRNKNNVIIHRIIESEASYEKERNTEDDIVLLLYLRLIYCRQTATATMSKSRS